MTLTTTFRRLRQQYAWEKRYKFLRKALKGVKDNDPINLLTILKVNGLDDALLALHATVEDCDQVARLMAADFAEAILAPWDKYSRGEAPRCAIKAARAFAHGRICPAELEAARRAAYDAYAAAFAASDADTYDAAYAAYAATFACAAHAAYITANYGAGYAPPNSAIRAKQVKIFTSYLQP